MEDPERQEWSRHYDVIQWQVITIFTAGVAGLAAYSVSQGSQGSMLADAAGCGLMLLGVFYVASFRSFRNHLHGDIKDTTLKAFLEDPRGDSRLPKQWIMFVASFWLISLIFDYQLAIKSAAHFAIVLASSFGIMSLSLYLLWRAGGSHGVESR